MSDSLIFGERPERFAPDRSFPLSDLSKSLICSFIMSDLSESLICLERPERFAHSCSFVLSDLSESLTVAHLIWAKWANEWWANERIPSPEKNKIVCRILGIGISCSGLCRISSLAKLCEEQNKGKGDIYCKAHRFYRNHIKSVFPPIFAMLYLIFAKFRLPLIV